MPSFFAYSLQKIEIFGHIEKILVTFVTVPRNTIFRMKQLITILVLSLTLLASCGRSDDRVVGGYTDPRRPTTEERALFEAAVASIDDTTYKPLNVATQVVAGTNYRFVCKARENGPPRQTFRCRHRDLQAAARGRANRA